MRKAHHFWLAGLAGAIAMAAVATADPIDPAHIPADARWVVHVDMDAARKTAAWKELYHRLGTDQDFQAFLLELEEVFNARFPEDLHDVTVCGSKLGDADSVVLVHATIDRKQIENRLAGLAGYSSTPRGKYSVLSWSDSGKPKFGGFVTDSLFMVGPNKEKVNTQFDVLAGKAPSLKVDAAMPRATKAACTVFVAGDALVKNRPAADNAWLGKIKSAWLTIAEEREETLVKLTVGAVDVSTAMQLKEAAEGLRDTLKTSAMPKDAKPITKKLAEVTNAAQIGQLENNVAVQCRVPNKIMPELIDEALTVARKK